jgi:hypothetical protein
MLYCQPQHQRLCAFDVKLHLIQFQKVVSSFGINKALVQFAILHTKFKNASKAD